MKSRPIKEKRLDGLESDFEPLLISCLRECAGGRWGLFGQNDASDVARYCQWDEAEQLKEIARDSRVTGGVWSTKRKGSPKPQPTVKSITWLLPSHHHSVINPDHVSLLRALLRNAGPLLSWAAKSPS